jgi:hypothetical protein
VMARSHGSDLAPMPISQLLVGSTIRNALLSCVPVGGIYCTMFWVDFCKGSKFLPYSTKSIDLTCNLLKVEVFTHGLVKSSNLVHRFLGHISKVKSFAT